MQERVDINRGMRQRVGRLGSAERGNAALELAMVLPFLLATVMGIIEFGRVLYIQQVMTNAARESSRASATGYEPYTAAADRVLSPAGIPTPSATCTGTPVGGQTTICQTIVTIPVSTTTTQAHQVAITYNVQYITPLGSVLTLIGGNSVWGSGITLISSAVMRQ